MKKIVIILSAILLTWGVEAYAQEIPPVTSDQPVKKSITSTTGTTSPKVSSVTLDRQEIILYIDGEAQELKPTVKPVNAGNIEIVWSNHSNGTISKVDNGIVSAVSVGKDTVYAKSQIDPQKFAICIIEVKVDSLAWFRSQYLGLSTEIQKNNGKIISLVQDTVKNEIKIEFSEIEEDRLISNNVLYILMLLAILVIIVLLGWLYITKKQAKDKSTKRKIQFDEFQVNLDNSYSDNAKLTEKIQQLSAEIEKLKDEKTNLRTEIYQSQQKQKSIDDPKPQPVAQPQSLSLYADAIIDGKFNRVTEEPDSRSIFELKLAKAYDTRATVIIYPAAYGRIIANPSFLEGCEKQVLGSTVVTIIHEGIAQKDSSGKWSLTTIPKVKIS